MNNRIKSRDRMAGWAQKKHQINHKIICAYLICMEKDGVATFESMRKLCSQNNTPLYVQKFDANYRNMKTEAGNSHGKVFEDDGHNVWLWKTIESDVLSRKNIFLEGKTW